LFITLALGLCLTGQSLIFVRQPLPDFFPNCDFAEIAFYDANTGTFQVSILLKQFLFVFDKEAKVSTGKVTAILTFYHLTSLSNYETMISDI
jgi:hypothetical protein